MTKNAFKLSTMVGEIFEIYSSYVVKNATKRLMIRSEYVAWWEMFKEGSKVDRGLNKREDYEFEAHFRLDYYM